MFPHNSLNSNPYYTGKQASSPITNMQAHNLSSLPGNEVI